MTTSIEWAQNADGTPGETWNPTRGCDKVSPGCKHCYAETFAERWRGVQGHPYERGFDFRLVPEALDKPLRRKKPTTYFVNSMSDLFHKDTPNEYIAAVFGVMAACPQHRFIILTKRAERLPEWFAWLDSQPAGRGVDGWACDYLAQIGFETGCGSAFDPDVWPLPNVWIGVSVEDQDAANKRIPPLLRTPAAVRLLSCEPLLSVVDLSEWLGTAIERAAAHERRTGHHAAPLPLGRGDRFDVIACAESGCGSASGYQPRPDLHWVIVGGESGPGARPMRLEWARSIVEQCRAAGVACFVKQLGARPAMDEAAWRALSPSPLLTPRSEDPVIKGAGLVQLAQTNKKGSDMAEWPADLRVREFPEVRGG